MSGHGFESLSLRQKPFQARSNALVLVDLLSDKRIRALRPLQKPYRIADGRAMYLLVSPAGGKLWRLKFRLDGKERVLALGQYPDVSIADARDKRDAARKLIAKGIDPVAQKRGQRDARHQAAGHPFSAASEAYFDHNEPHGANRIGATCVVSSTN